MEQKNSNNQLTPPSAQKIKKTLGANNYDNYKRLNRIIKKHGAICEWNYYKGSKSWLCRVRRGNNTVMWMSVWDGYFRLSFYFTEKTKDGVLDLDIEKVIKNCFKQVRVKGKLTPLILEIRDAYMLDSVEKIIRYQVSCM